MAETCIRSEPRRNWCLACTEDRPEDCSLLAELDDEQAIADPEVSP